MFIFTFSSSHSHRGLVVIDCDWFDDNEWVRMNGSCLLKDENEFDNLFFSSFLFCNDENKQGMKWNFNFIRFVFHFCSVWWLLAILTNRNQSSFFLDCNLRKRDFDQIGRNDRNLNRICKVCFEFVFLFFLIWGLLKTRNVERGLKSACSQQLVKFEKERKKERKVWFFAFVKLDETPSRLDWMSGWNWLQSNKQRFRQRQNSIFFFFFQRVREMRFYLVFIPFFWYFSNDFFESRSI